MALNFPDNPTTGQIFVGDNTVTYVYAGDRWSSALAMHLGVTNFVYEGGFSNETYDPLIDSVIDGGDAGGFEVPVITTTDITIGQYASGTVSYEWTASEPIVEAGILIGTRDQVTYESAVDYCDDPTANIQKFILRNPNSQYSVECGDPVEMNPESPIAQYIVAEHWAGQTVDIYSYVKTETGAYLSNKQTTHIIYTPCLAEGTLITLADGTSKVIEDINYNDMLLVWNFDLGEYSEALPLWIKQPQYAEGYYNIRFSNNTELKVIGSYPKSHRIFNKESGMFTYASTEDTPIGTTTFADSENDVYVVSKEFIQEPVTYYNVFSQYHMNVFANGILTSTGFNNLYHVADMRFEKDDRTLRSMEELEGIDTRWIDGLRLRENTTSIDGIKNQIKLLEKLAQTDLEMV
jgi:hypothetical protein